MKKITPSSGNVYADIGVAQPEAMLAKAQLAQRIVGIIAARKLTQREASEIMAFRNQNYQTSCADNSVV